MRNNSLGGADLSRFLLEPSDSKVQVDRINRNPLDNRRANLRFCTNQENCTNRGTKGDCKYKGITIRRKGVCVY